MLQTPFRTGVQSRVQKADFAIIIARGKITGPDVTWSVIVFWTDSLIENEFYNMMNISCKSLGTRLSWTNISRAGILSLKSELRGLSFNKRQNLARRKFGRKYNPLDIQWQ